MQLLERSWILGILLITVFSNQNLQGEDEHNRLDAIGQNFKNERPEIPDKLADKAIESARNFITNTPPLPSSSWEAFTAATVDFFKKGDPGYGEKAKAMVALLNDDKVLSRLREDERFKSDEDLAKEIAKRLKIDTITALTKPDSEEAQQLQAILGAIKSLPRETPAPKTTPSASPSPSATSLVPAPPAASPTPLAPAPLASPKGSPDLVSGPIAQKPDLIPGPLNTPTSVGGGTPTENPGPTLDPNVQPPVFPTIDPAATIDPNAPNAVNKNDDDDEDDDNKNVNRGNNGKNGEKGAGAADNNKKDNNQQQQQPPTPPSPGSSGQRSSAQTPQAPEMPKLEKAADIGSILGPIMQSAKSDLDAGLAKQIGPQPASDYKSKGADDVLKGIDDLNKSQLLRIQGILSGFVGSMRAGVGASKAGAEKMSAMLAAMTGGGAGASGGTQGYAARRTSAIGMAAGAQAPNGAGVPPEMGSNASASEWSPAGGAPRTGGKGKSSWRRLARRRQKN